MRRQADWLIVFAHRVENPEGLRTVASAKGRDVMANSRLALYWQKRDFTKRQALRHRLLQRKALPPAYDPAKAVPLRAA